MVQTEAALPQVLLESPEQPRPTATLPNATRHPPHSAEAGFVAILAADQCSPDVVRPCLQVRDQRLGFALYRGSGQIRAWIHQYIAIRIVTNWNPESTCDAR